jgi:hypothetical protein
MTEAEFVAGVRINPVNRTILERLPELALSDCWLVSGALFQTAWNVKTGRAPTHGISDYDIFYFDADTSWDAEDKAIARARELFRDLDAEIQLRNQARVHLWYEAKFGRPYPPLSCACDGIDRFLMPAAQVGMRRREGRYETYAPRGFDDIANMIVRPNRTPNFSADRYFEKTARWKTCWPELTILPA